MNGDGYVYMMTNRPRGVIYTGVTSDLQGRVSQHLQGLTPGFATKYQCKTLVWYERHLGIESAIQREKSLKRYRRDWKLNLIEAFNPAWDDLFDQCQVIDDLFQPRFMPEFEELPEDPRDGARG